MAELSQQRYTSLWIGMSIVLLIALSIYFEFFNRFDRWLYDEAIQVSHSYTVKAPQVLLVEVKAEYKGLSVDNWFKLLQQIQQYKPAAIAINLLPWNWADKDIKRATENFNLTIGSLQPDENLMVKDIVYSAKPPLDGNTYRKHHHQGLFKEKYYPDVLSEVAGKVTQLSTSFDEDYFVNFIGGPGRIPVVSSQRVLDAGLVESLVRDKVVLIGVKTPMMMELLSPLGMLPYEHYEAYALDTLLNNNSIQIADLWIVLLLVLLLVLIMLLAILKIPDRFQLIAIIGFIFVTLAISYFSLVLFNYWLMPGYLFITEFSILIALLFLRNQQNQQALQSMALNSAARIESHWLSESFYTSEAHWNHIANMVTQTLSLERTIFLERVENDHRVREIKALNCSLNDVGEMRRDYQRTPYTTAIEHGGALKLNRPYLEATADDEVQFLMPLSFAGNIQGFWAFTIKHNAHLEEEKLIDAVEQFAVQIAELLYHWSEWGKSQQSKRSLAVKLLQMKFEENSYDSINHSINFLTHRLSVMESVMDGLETLAILYDLFGRVVHVNKSMTNMLTDIKLLPYSMTTVDLIVNLSGCSMTEARNYLSYLILEKASINLPVKNDGVKTGYMMVISALKNDTDIEDAEGEVAPFEMIGILCELIDMSQIRELYSQKEKIIKYMSGWLRNDLSSISMACDLAQDKRLSTDKHNQLMGLIKGKVNELAGHFKQVNFIVQQDLVSKVSSQYPVDYTESLQLAITECLNLHNKSVIINPVIPFFSPLVMAAPKELRQIFFAIINILITDALEESEITINISSDNKQVSFEFINKGFGIPQEQFQSYMQKSENLASNEFQNLRHAAKQLDSWGEELDAISEIGEGMRFHFSLKAFLL
jgi:CHASE2 domain-containing protein